MSDRQLTEEQRSILHDMAQQLAATEDRKGMVTAVVVQYIIMDEEGEERIGGWYDGGYVQALGLLEDAKSRLLFPEDE